MRTEIIQYNMLSVAILVINVNMTTFCRKEAIWYGSSSSIVCAIVGIFTLWYQLKSLVYLGSNVAAKSDCAIS